MEIKQRLEDWKNNFNPLYLKEYKTAYSSLAVNENIFIISIIGKDIGIIITKSFPTHSNTNEDYLKGDLCNLNNLLILMEQDFLLQLDILINKLDI